MWCCPGWGRSVRARGRSVSSGLEQPARAALEADVPFFGVCVGFQLLYEGSVESPGAAGLGVFPGTIGALPPGVKHPQMQWNTLEVRGAVAPLALEGLGERPWVYFVHSFAPPVGDETVAVCDYGGPSRPWLRGARCGARSSTLRSRGPRGWRCWPTSCAWHRRARADGAAACHRPARPAPPYA